MPGYLLHVGAVVMCAHGGTAQPTVPNPRVKVMGQPIVMQPAPYVVAGCTFPPPPVANGPCVTAQWILGALRVKANGMPVLLQDSQAICTPTGTPLNIVMTQMRVKGMWAEKYGQPEIHHSDQGVQYAATAYTAELRARGIQISMAEVGEPTQNGYAERLMRTIKEEEVDLSDYDDYHDALTQLGKFLDDVYMHKSVHSSLGYLTPAEFEAQWRAQQARSSDIP